MAEQDTTGYYLYVLELERHKVYVGITTNPQRRIDEHLRDTGVAHAWTNKYKVVRVVCCCKLSPECDERALENKMTYEIMKVRGIENVMGGVFCLYKTQEGRQKKYNEMEASEHKYKRRYGAS